MRHRWREKGLLPVLLFVAVAANGAGAQTGRPPRVHTMNLEGVLVEGVFTYEAVQPPQQSDRITTLSTTDRFVVCSFPPYHLAIDELLESNFRKSVAHVALHTTEVERYITLHAVLPRKREAIKVDQMVFLSENVAKSGHIIISTAPLTKFSSALGSREETSLALEQLGDYVGEVYLGLAEASKRSPLPVYLEGQGIWRSRDEQRGTSMTVSRFFDQQGHLVKVEKWWQAKSGERWLAQTIDYFDWTHEPFLWPRRMRIVHYIPKFKVYGSGGGKPGHIYEVRFQHLAKPASPEELWKFVNAKKQFEYVDLTRNPTLRFRLRSDTLPTEREIEETALSAVPRPRARPPVARWTIPWYSRKEARQIFVFSIGGLGLLWLLLRVMPLGHNRKKH